MAVRIHPQDVLKALAAVNDVNTQKDIVSLGFVRDLEVGDNRVAFTLQLPDPASPASGSLMRSAEEAVRDVQVLLAARPSPAARPQANLIPQVKSTVAVASGKGGVGKSTVAVNLAVALHRQGARVGLMDTDVYGPSVPHLMGSQKGPVVVEGKLAPPEE